MDRVRVSQYVQCLLVFVFIPVFSASAEAQDWARKMFGEKTDSFSHDFGIVAVGSDAVHRFEFQNLYEEDIHIASVTSSCKCTSATIEARDLKTHEAGAIIARFNTTAFRGPKQATLTVRIDRPYYAEVQLIVRGNIRGNVAFEPGSIQFGEVPEGTMVEKRIRVVHRGNPGWEIRDVKTTFDQSQIKVGLQQTYRAGGMVNYDMVVQLQDNVPAGFVQGELFIETNEGANFRYPLVFNGRVQPALRLSQPVLALGPLAPGEIVEKKILLQANEPFRITNITCSHDCLHIEAGDEPQKLQMMTVKFTAGDNAGQYECQARIETDAGETVFRTIVTVENR